MANVNNQSEPIEVVFDLAVEKLRRGQALDSILAESPAQFQTELRDLLDFAQIGLSVPKNPAPRAVKRYQFAENANFERSWINILLPWLKFSIVPGGALAILMMTINVANAHPGGALFGLRKNIEKTQLVFTQDQDKIASIQLELAQKRLEDAQAAINSNDPSQQEAALNELNSQTQLALNSVKQAATAKAISKQDNSSLLSRMTEIADAQANLAAKVAPENQTSPAANSALATTKESKDVIAEIKRLGSAVNGQEAANLDSNSIFIIGNLAAKSSNTITVENNTFTVNKDTSIKDQNDQTLDLASINLKAKISVTGNKNSNTSSNPVAIKITVLDDPQADKPVPPKVKGDSTTTPSSTTPASPAAPQSNPPQSTTTDPNSAIGAVMFEAPGDLSH